MCLLINNATGQNKRRNVLKNFYTKVNNNTKSSSRLNKMKLRCGVQLRKPKIIKINRDFKFSNRRQSLNKDQKCNKLKTYGLILIL